MALMLIVLTIFIVGNFDLSYGNYVATPVTETKSGQVVGAVKTLANGNKINEYLGIPFAEPPTGELRFKKPVPVTPWKKTFEAVKERTACMQVITKHWKMPVVKSMSEDCLFMNIWTPNGHSMVDNDTKLLPVMFWIPGSGLNEGSIYLGDMYDGSYLSSLGDVIVVTTNYRLGPLGFFYDGTNEMPGNMGLHDQLLALKWVRENIAAFGGDANSITIAGESAGGWSASAMVLSPLAKGLFKRAIIQSGAINSNLGSQAKEKSASFTRTAAMKYFKCFGTSEAIVKCLRSKPAEDFVKVKIDFAQNDLAIYGDEYLPLKPSLALKRGKFNPVDVLFGHVKDEGTFFILPYLDNIGILTKFVAKIVIKQIFAKTNVHFENKVADFYIDAAKDGDRVGIAQAIAASFGDCFITCPTVSFGSSVAKWNVNNTAYAYKLTQAPTNSFFEKGDSSEKWRGVVHGEDVIYLFGAPLRDGQAWPEKDKQLSRDFINSWTTFAKTGHIPTVGSKSWNEAIDRNEGQTHVKYMELSSQLKMIEHGYDKTCEGFWKQFIEE